MLPKQKKKNTSKVCVMHGFTLLEILLAVFLFSCLVYGAVAFFQKYEKESVVRTLVNDLSDIAASYEAMQNNATVSGFYDYFTGKISTGFLKSVPIPVSHIATPDATYSYLSPGLTVAGKPVRVGFRRKNYSDSSAWYLVAGMTVNHAQLVQIIRQTGSTFGVFYGSGRVPLERAVLASKLPACASSTACTYSLYLVSPKTDVTFPYVRNVFIDTRFYAPLPGA